MDNEHMQTAIKELQDAMVVMEHIQKQQSEHIRDLSEFSTERSRIWPKITGQLNGLIGFIAVQRPGGSKQ